ncbi:MFS transporter [Propioniciclava flava]|uniref:Major facilitator superfamily (MFS) profile domain-containing protein n=1 Tax=Propioniciclava flava TaxID=2072026 RepID=A0A4Q2EKF7_9ACTN|nr:MFS transporter [Propioniciclava flava]RXW33246.1 hypothetical protein C1706_00290 [Propioniciclava flava]
MSVVSTAKTPHPWWVAFVCGMATFVDAATTGIGIALVLFQSMEPGQPGLSANEVGFLTAALALGVAVGSLLGGRLGDRFGRRTVFLVTMVLIVLGSIAPFLSLNFGIMFLGIAVIGLGVGADLPVALASISEAATDDNRGKLIVFSNLIPVLFGFTFATVLSSVLLATVAGAFCFETIMKVWTQESFPTLMRGTAQGFIYGISRFAAAGLNAVTPMLLAFNAKGLYLGIAVLAAAGFAIGWVGFRKGAANQFDSEATMEPLGASPARLVTGTQGAMEEGQR